MDVLGSTERVCVINGIPCASVYEMIFAKMFYGLHQNIEKHMNDLSYLYAKNPVLSLKIGAVMLYRAAKALLTINKKKKDKITPDDIDSDIPF